MEPEPVQLAGWAALNPGGAPLKGQRGRQRIKEWGGVSRGAGPAAAQWTLLSPRPTGSRTIAVDLPRQPSGLGLRHQRGPEARRIKSFHNKEKEFLQMRKVESPSGDPGRRRNTTGPWVSYRTGSLVLSCSECGDFLACLKAATIILEQLVQFYYTDFPVLAF